jgi:hypothetical protein
VLRGRGSGESKLAFSDQHQIANVNKRVWEIRENTNRITPKNKVNAHENTSGDAPIPKRDWDNTFALAFRGKPLDKKTHREQGVPNEAKDHEITPIQAKESVFFADPGESNNCDCVHRQLIDSVMS